jgi:hypothetical protein
MTRSLRTPETTADALLLVRALDNPFIAPQLAERYDANLVRSALGNAFAWVDHGFDGRPLAACLATADTHQEPAIALDQTATGEFDISELAQEPLDRDSTDPTLGLPETPVRVIGRRPEKFGLEESALLLTALSEMARLPNRRLGVKREVMHYLARNAPTSTQRFLSRVALQALKTANQLGLLQYSHARVTRGRNSPDWFAQIAAESSD